MKRILCYGDSNTFGFDPEDNANRFDEGTRWTCLLAKELGVGYRVMEEGLNGRTISSEGYTKYRKGNEYLLPCIDSHAPLDLIVVMLGTNELNFELSAKEIAEMLEREIVRPIRKHRYEYGERPKILVVVPAAVSECERDFLLCDGICVKSKGLAVEFEDVSKRNDCFFLSAVDLAVGSDGVHLTKDSHRELASRLTKTVKEILG